MNCETNLTSEYAPKSPWPTGFDKSKIHLPLPEKLQLKTKQDSGIFACFSAFSLEIKKIA